MTCREKLMAEDKEKLVDFICNESCPNRCGLIGDEMWDDCDLDDDCEIPDTDLVPGTTAKAFENVKKNAEVTSILDSGDRTEFETGAVRDMREGKGRCDLMPLDVIADLYDEHDRIFGDIFCFQDTGNYHYLIHAVNIFKSREWTLNTKLLEVAKHFEDGAKKYGENNWQKGIPAKCYIDSAVRHYLKYLRGDTDEPHDRAFVWNILCCIWTCKHKPELNDYKKEN